MYIEEITKKMKEYFNEDSRMIDHTLNVLSHAEAIMQGEKIEGEVRERISVIAVLHDIGIPEAIRKYGSSEARYQEKEGEIIARRLLQETGYEKDAERIVFIVGNHHTPSKIDGIDFQVQWEADLLENMKTMKLENQSKVRKLIDDNFKTGTGKRLAMERFVAP